MWYAVQVYKYAGKINTNQNPILNDGSSFLLLIISHNTTRYVFTLNEGWVGGWGITRAYHIMTTRLNGALTIESETSPIGMSAYCSLGFRVTYCTASSAECGIHWLLLLLLPPLNRHRSIIKINISLAQQRGGVVLVEELFHGMEKPLPVALAPQHVRVVPINTESIRFP